MSNVLITGANRGLGLSLTIRYLEDGDTVFACCREKRSISVLSSLKKKYGNRLFFNKLDVTKEKEISESEETISKRVNSIDILINNAGVIFRNESVSAFNAENAEDAFAVNSTGPMLMVKHFIRLLKCSQNPKIVNISSLSGSISRVSGFSGLYSYKASKAALNMFTKILSSELKDAGIIVTSIHPGVMKTEMNGNKGDITPEESSMKIFNIIDKLKMKDSGSFIDYNRKRCQW